MTENKGLTGQSQENNGGGDCVFGADRPAREQAIQMICGVFHRIDDHSQSALLDAQQLVDALVAAVREGLPPLACRRLVYQEPHWESRCPQEDGHDGPCVESGGWSRTEPR